MCVVRVTCIVSKHDLCFCDMRASIVRNIPTNVKLIANNLSTRCSWHVRNVSCNYVCDVRVVAEANLVICTIPDSVELSQYYACALRCRECQIIDRITFDCDKVSTIAIVNLNVIACD